MKLFPLTIKDLTELLPGIKNAEAFVPILNDLLPIYEITTPKRVAAFLAQTGHESASYNTLEEKASGDAYEGRKDLGNKQKGDGRKFKGRGVIQLTGRDNYTSFGSFAKTDLIAAPAKLKEPFLAVLAACWYWKKRNLNPLADDALFDEITKKINGGLNGKADRDKRYKKALEYFNSNLRLD